MTNVAPVAIPILDARALSLGFDNVQASDDADFDIHHGEVVVLIGEDGAAKSTMAKAREQKFCALEKHCAAM